MSDEVSYIVSPEYNCYTALKYTLPVIAFTGKKSFRFPIFQLKEPFELHLSIYKGTSGKVIESIQLPAGFESDGASIPLIFGPLFGDRNSYLIEAIIHDWLLDTDLPIWVINAKMRAIMILLGKKRWKAALIFWALVLFGKRSPLYSLIELSVKLLKRLLTLPYRFLIRRKTWLW